MQAEHRGRHRVRLDLLDFERGQGVGDEFVTGRLAELVLDY